jgi:Sec-independent protein translocase protein TatA
MEFMNVGGGELLIIILLALVLFSPEDILKLMRTIGNYARTARQMWTNVSRSLQDDYLPEDVKEVVKETANTVKDARTTLADVREQFNDITTSVEDEVGEVTQLAGNEVSVAVDTVNETYIVDEEDEILSEDEEELSSETDESSPDLEIPEDDETTLEQHIMTTQAIIESLLNPPKNQNSAEKDDVDKKELDSETSDYQDTDILNEAQEIHQLEQSTALTKEVIKKPQDHKGPIDAITVNAKLAKVTEELLKDDGSDS